MNYKSSLEHKVFKAVSKVADASGDRAFVIGGFVRDLILERPCKDIDIVTEGSGIKLAKAAAKELGIKQVSVFKNFGTAMFKCGDFEVEWPFDLWTPIIVFLRSFWLTKVQKF